MARTPPRFDIHCRVVDHFGDAGFAWRLARTLHHAHGCEVRLWIDDLATLARIVPGATLLAAPQHVDGVAVAPIALADEAAPADVVVEAFGCGLSEAVQDAMESHAPPPAMRDGEAVGARPAEANARRNATPIWIVLEYLSAEPFVDGVHGLASPPPRRALERWFFWPGFTPRTGGLLREPGLIAERDAFVVPPREGLAVSLFSYENAALPALLDAWAGGPTPVTLTVPEGIAARSLARFAGHAWPAAAARFARGALTVDVVPFVSQPAFDRRLWSCDFNIVRGEDSFVRAQWAARPFAWHAYRQPEDAHLAKLDAFAARYLAGADPAPARAWRDFQLAFDREDGDALATAWSALHAALPPLAAHARTWAAALARLPELAASLVEFAEMRYN